LKLKHSYTEAHFLRFEWLTLLCDMMMYRQQDAVNTASHICINRCNRLSNNGQYMVSIIANYLIQYLQQANSEQSLN